ncbi:helix-turn-helix domain-containing protein [Mesorhizobium salmacidum]|uniref:Helix-turn-helix domain-containing protein n=1 Tax=Mesorhizobium salmacidum TaxID=3015171 RepID=A0ABU8L430_9HYPH
MDAGWTVIPNVILERQKAFGLDAVDINILLHLASYWWHPDNKPHPSKQTIAVAMGIDPRTVQRRIAAMEKDGLLQREERRVSQVGSKSNIYHLDGLIKAAKPFAKEMVQIKKAKIAVKDAMRARKGKPQLHLVKGAD